MRLKEKPAPPPVRPEELGSNASQLTFSVALDAATYRFADPIAIDFFMHNRSSSPMRTIPPVTSGWWPTMAYGIRLERLGETSTVLVDTEPSDNYIGSYSGPPSFETLRPEDVYSRRDCFHHWAEWAERDVWPLPEGKYRLTITFDNAQFAQVSAERGEVLHRWQSRPVEFAVSGSARTDPDELLKLIAEKAKLRWLKTDLASPNYDRCTQAWWAVHIWGDDRLTPILPKRGNTFGEIPSFNQALRRSGWIPGKKPDEPKASPVEPKPAPPASHPFSVPPITKALIRTTKE
jgi:hypothetical protein